MTTILRWVRKFTMLGRKGRKRGGLKTRTSPPASRRGFQKSLRQRPEPTASTSIRTFTPARAFSVSRSRQRVPISSGLKM